MVRARIAPTPSGYLHQGNIFNFLLTWLLVRKQGGSLLLRIDDIDATRTRREYLEDIFYMLDWLGLDYDQGPQGVEDFYRHHSQQLRLDMYQQSLDLLWKQGHLFACRCSRRQIQQRSQDGHYPGSCLGLGLPPEAPGVAWRLHTPAGLSVEWEDIYLKQQRMLLYSHIRHFVVRRKDGLPAYQLVSVLEDLHHRINLLVRGQDLITSTAAQLFLASLLGGHTFEQARFLHHPLLLDQQGQKLSKSAGAASHQSLISYWKQPVNCYKWMARLLQLPEAEIHRLEDLLLHFDPLQLQTAIEKGQGTPPK
ncbi:MAG: glutamate--tRNA ligase [Bacteroidetes bacterium]|nr:MAG: glutamate--tRNA ligase [Bacteroidota bacterium]